MIQQRHEREHPEGPNPEASATFENVKQRSPQTTIGVKKRSVDTVRDMETAKFMKTDINKYLDQDAHVNCISCQKCIREKNKLLQFKYNP